MDNNIMSNELESMKAQLGLLKEKLEKQEIVKEQHLRKAIKGKLREINRIAVKMMLVGLFAILYCIWWLNHFGFSVYLQAGTFLMLAFSTIATFVQHRNLLAAKELSADLVKETFDLVKLKKRYSQWLYLAIPMVLVWFSLMVYEIANVIAIKEFAATLIAGAAIGAVIGGIVGMKIHYRTIRKIDEMLAQIKELKE
ncbi:MAG: hypothetical protein IKJ97_00205 [Bacteroidaceae bacterium]|nr:hypothetical protein [Bacteroidaceae bacterium]